MAATAQKGKIFFEPVITSAAEPGESIIVARLPSEKVRPFELKMSRTFEQDFTALLKAIREWAEIGNPMPAKNATEKLSWLFQEYDIVPDTPAGLEQQHTAQRLLEEALRQAAEHAAET